MSVNGASIILGIASWVTYLAIGCKHTWMTYWPPLAVKPIVTHSLPYPENERQWNLNDFWCCILASLSVALWQWFVYEGMAAFSTETVHDIFVTPSCKWVSTERQQFVIMCIGQSSHCPDIWAHIGTIDPLYRQNPIYKRKNTDCKIIDIAICETCKKRLLAAEFVILVRYYYQTANARGLYESTDRPAGRPADNPPNSDELSDPLWTLPELTVLMYWRPGRWIWQLFGFDQDLDLEQRSGTFCNTTV